MEGLTRALQASWKYVGAPDVHRQTLPGSKRFLGVSDGHFRNSFPSFARPPRRPHAEIERLVLVIKIFLFELSSMSSVKEY